MSDTLLVINAGSSSLKFTVFALGPGGPARQVRGVYEELTGATRFRARDASGATLAERAWDAAAAPGHAGALDHLFAWLAERGGGADAPVAVGHRVVHGGTDFVAPVLVDADIVARLETLAPLAPLHQPHNLLPIRDIAALKPDLPQIACFDTAFHAGAPAIAQAYALPPEIVARGVRRFGFHGISYEYVASVLPERDPEAAAGRVVAMHLGNGASMCGMLGGRSVASTMGFTALDGLPMGTRSGALDPGVVLYLMQSLGMGPAEIEDLLYRRSGLLGVSGIASDMRSLTASDAPSARFAVELFAYRIGRELGSLAAALGGLDAVVFTAGIGENSAELRGMAAEHAAWLGLALDPKLNESGGGVRRISAAGSRVSAWVIPTDEELMIARHTEATLAKLAPA